jgi:hypothetical protein
MISILLIATIHCDWCPAVRRIFALGSENLG